MEPLGILVVEFLENHFKQCFEYDYISQMEEDLMKFNGNIDWQELCENCQFILDNLHYVSDPERVQF